MQINNSVPLGTEISIRGKVYRIDLTSNQVIERTRIFNQKRNRCIRNTPFLWINQLGTKKFMCLCWEYIDGLLGEGACERYFEGRACSVDQIMYFLGYVADEIEKQRLEQGGSVYGKY